MRRSWVPMAAVVLAAALFTPVSAAGSAPNSDSATPSSWSVAPTERTGSFEGVSCRGTHFCVAVGSSGLSTLIEMWDGHSWTVSPSPRVQGVLRSVSCASAVRCEAVGGRSGRPAKPFIESWNGVRWSLRSGFAWPGGGNAELSAVSCAAPKSCVAVGSYFDGAHNQTFAARWDGRRWARIPFLLPAPGWSSPLWGVSCPSPTRCFAIGAAYRFEPGGSDPPAGIGTTVIETWDGRGWSVMPPAPWGTGSSGSFTDISCSDSEHCVVVGQGPRGGVLIERFDGTSWAVEHPTLARQGREKALYGVSCISRTSCVAVGSAHFDYRRPYTAQALIIAFDGVRWSAAPGPTPLTSSNSLSAVSCSATRCAAVGNSYGLFPNSPPLVVEGSISRRSVSVSWTAAENARLRQISAYLHRSPAATQKAAVYAVAYLLGLAPRSATHASLPPAGSAATYTTVWNPSELTVLDSVRVYFGTNSAGATRASVYLYSYLLALAGH